MKMVKNKGERMEGREWGKEISEQREKKEEKEKKEKKKEWVW